MSKLEILVMAKHIAKKDGLSVAAQFLRKCGISFHTAKYLLLNK